LSNLLNTEEVAFAQVFITKLQNTLNEVLFDQGAVVTQVVTAILARGHVLLEGLPGTGKTELCKGLSKALGLDFKRIQFTPDLLPGDITGTYVIDAQNREFSFRKGPLFASVVLADEINRSSPKTQSALLEAMQERSVTVLGTTHTLPNPFFVLATQNPIELEGTYPLPEAQLDRFLFRILVPAVGAKTLTDMLLKRTRGQSPPIAALMEPAQLNVLFELVDRVHLPVAVADYIGRLVEASHPQSPLASEKVKTFVRYGASPRAALAMAASARALALIRAKPNVGFDEVRDVAGAVFNHRLVLNWEAGLEKWSQSALVNQLLSHVGEVVR
jgi:MoxR-like ATPase